MLLAIGGARVELTEVLKRHADVYVAMDNCPHQVVLFAPSRVADELAGIARAHGALCSRLPFNRAYHTPMFRPFCDTVARFFDRMQLAPPAIALYSCAIASRCPDDVEALRWLAAEQWATPVRFRETIDAMYADGERIFVEVGPRNNLTAFIDDILGRRSHLAVPSNVAHRSGLTQLQHLIAQLAAHGVPMVLDALYQRRMAVDLASTRDSAPRHGATAASGSVTLPTGLQPLRLPASRTASPQPIAPCLVPPVAQPFPTVSPTAFDFSDRAELMRGHLKTMRRFVEVQQDIMQAFLGAATGGGGTVGITTEATTARQETAVLSGALASSVPSSTTIVDIEATDPGQTLLAIVSERTGYPIDMLDTSLDLEADLGIDSIKRVEIVSALQQRGCTSTVSVDRLTSAGTLAAMLQLLRADSTGLAAASVHGGAQEREAATTLEELPLVGSVISNEPGRELITSRTLDIDDDLFLRDHTFGTAVSNADPDLRGLPIVPLTMSIEMLAEAAAALGDGKIVVAIRNIRAHQWIALDRGRTTLRIMATQRAAGSSEIDVRIVGAGNGNRDATLVEGTVTLAAAYPSPPAALPPLGGPGRASEWTSERLYSEIMFHGPSFRAVESMDRWTDDGAEATLVALPPHGMFRAIESPRFLTDPVILDAAGQVVGYWIAEGSPRAYHVFPFRVEAVEIYGPPFQPGARPRCSARIETVGDWQLRSAVDIAAEDGAVRYRLAGWEDKRFELPETFYRFRIDPRAGRLGRPWTTAKADRAAGISCVLVDDLPRELLEAHGRIWLRVLGHLVLSRRERDVWNGLPYPPGRRADWLLGRVAAKEAVRDFLRRKHDIAVCLADIEIAPDDDRCPRVGGEWATRITPPVVSISHAAGLAAAAAADADAWRGVGLDVEPIARASGTFASAAFSPAEQALIAARADTDEWRLRLWCAKEAAGKAVGLGLVQGPRFAVAEGLDPESGHVDIALLGELASRAGSAATLPARTFRDGALVGAVVFMQRS